MSTLSAVLDSLLAMREPDGIWQPRLLAGADATTAETLSELARAGLITRVYDTLAEQLAELMEIEFPTLDLSADETAARVRAHLGGTPLREYGTWVFYPWSGRLVHVLPKAEFRALRTSRNRNKITIEEQNVLRKLRVGIIGLSVGAATALTLAMEEVGGEFVLADFDRLSLSNMNRLRAGVHAIDIKKAYLTARELYEVNPYVHVEIWPEGVTPENMDRFLAAPRKLDLLFDECDDLFVKVRVRERARALGIAVLMETSDRGLFDVERFDREPGRPLLHGIAGDLDAESLRGLSTYDKVPTVVRILDEARVSPRMAASMVEIDSTLTSWPQLASAVSLGAAINTDVARRIGLGQFTESGRFYIDLEEMIADGKSMALQALAPPEDAAPETLRDPSPPSLPSLRGVAANLLEQRARALVAYAVMAPSGGNCQPWRFELRGDSLHCIHVLERSVSFLDFGHRAAYLALGAAVENLTLAAAEMGIDAVAEPFPSASDATHVCALRFTMRTTPPRDTELFEQITKRTTNRKLGPRVPLSPLDADALAAAATSGGGKLRLLVGASQLDAIGHILGRGDRVRFVSRVMHREMMSEIRWNRAEVERTRDGIDLVTLELTPTDLAGMRITSKWRVMELVDMVGGGGTLEKASRKATAAASAVGLVSTAGTSPLAYFQAGRAMQRVWLRATAQGYAFQPMTALTYLFARLAWGGGEGFSSRQLTELGNLRSEYRKLFQLDEGEAEGMLFRLARTGPASARSLRRHVDDLFRVAP